MAQTVAQYALSRKVSESTVKGWITKLGLKLPDNPGDKRQRLILSEHKRELDKCGSAKPAAPEFFEAELVQEPIKNYDRSEETGLLIAEGSIVLAQSQRENMSPDQNRLIQALQLRTNEYERQNTQALTQIGINANSSRDLRAALDAARLVQIKEEATRRAVREFQLEQQTVENTKIELELINLGLSPLGKSGAGDEEDSNTFTDSPSPSSLSQSVPSDLF